MTTPPVRGGRAAVHVASGIFASRVIGFVRQKLFNYFLGTSLAAEAFNAAFRIPNALQNLLGEGVLSASFIPVYARVRATGDDRARRDVAVAVLSLLLVASSVLVLGGVLLAPLLVDLIAMGFADEKRALTVTLVRVLFPGAGLLVMYAWGLGILNSHGKFFLSYLAPVAWNVAMIAVLAFGGARTSADQLVVWLAWGSVAGSVLQLVVVWPSVLQLLGPTWPWSLGRGNAHVRAVGAAFVPVLLGRGVVQISAYIDSWIASYLVSGSVTILTNAQLLYMLPISLFGMSISAAELPQLAAERTDADGAGDRVRERVQVGLQRMLFFVLPSAVALVAIGDAIGGLLYGGGAFGASETRWLWWALIASAFGLLAAAPGRLFANVLFAFESARAVQRIALVRVIAGAVLGGVGAMWLVPRLGLDLRMQVAALSAGSAAGAWLECLLLRRAVSQRAGVGRLDLGLGRLLASAAIAAGVTAAARGAGIRPMASLGAVIACLLFGASYLAAAYTLGVPQARAMVLSIIHRARGMAR